MAPKRPYNPLESQAPAAAGACFIVIDHLKYITGFSSSGLIGTAITHKRESVMAKSCGLLGTRFCVKPRRRELQANQVETTEPARKESNIYRHIFHSFLCAALFLLYKTQGNNRFVPIRAPCRIPEANP
jgi:hypothetical protein